MILTAKDQTLHSDAGSRSWGNVRRTLTDMIKATPVVSDLFLQYYSFYRNVAHCRGVYASYELAHAQHLRRNHYNDHWVTAPEILGIPVHIRRRDYPVLLWLGSILPTCRKLLNLGGNIGSEFLTYRQFLHMPPDFQWLVWELPFAVELGEKLARQLGIQGISFTTRLEDGADADIVLVSGALQYFEKDLIAYLGRLSGRPLHVFINRVPVWEGETFFTLQNVGGSFVPYRIQSRQELVASFNDFGYRLVDCWFEDFRIRIPFHPERSIESFHGFYFRLGEDPQPAWQIEAIADAREARSRLEGVRYN